MKQSPLEFLIRSYLNPKDNNTRPIHLNDSQLKFIADNWMEIKKYFISFISKNEVDIFDIGYTLRDLNKFGASFTENEIEEFYSGLLEQNRLSDIAYLTDSTKIMPNRAQLEEVWRNFFNDNEWKDYTLETLTKYLGKPSLTQEDVNSIANDWLATLVGDKKCKEYRQPEAIRKFIEVCEKKPSWNKDLAQRVYDHWITYSLHDQLFMFLEEVVGIKPSDEKVQEYYEKLLTGKIGDDAYSTINGLEKIIKITGILPSEEFIQSFYKNNIHLLKERDIERIEKITNVKLKKELEEEYAQHKYSEYLRNGDICGINELKNKTKIMPRFDNDFVQDIYNDMFSNDNIGPALQVYLFTDIKPFVWDDIVHKAGKNLIKRIETEKFSNSLLEQLKWLTFYFGITKEVQSFFSKLVSEERFKTVEYLIGKLNVEPNPEEKYVIACHKADFDTAKVLYRKYEEKIKEKYPIYAQIMEELT